MSLFPPEPDPATAVTCPDCGEPISPEGLDFLGHKQPTLKEFHDWMDKIFATPPPNVDDFTFKDDGETITVYNADGTVHAHYGPESAAAVRKAFDLPHP